MKKATLRVLALCMIALLPLTGCGGAGPAGGTSAPSASDSGTVGGGASTDRNGWSAEQAAPAESTGNTPPLSPALKSAKIILEGSMELQAQNFDEADDFVRSLTTGLGGYLEATSVSGETGYRYAEYTVRIPQEKYDSFFAQVGEKCHVLSSSSQARNITEEYVDLEARLATQRTKHTRLLALLEKADTMEAIVALQTELSNTEYEMERLTGSLRKYDNLVDFSTVRLVLREVRELDPVAQGNSFLSELTQAFRQGTSGVLALMRGTVLFAVLFWPLMLIAVVVLVVAMRRMRRAKLPKSAPARPKSGGQDDPH